MFFDTLGVTLGVRVKSHQMVGFTISLLDLTLTPEVPEVQCALGSTLSDTGTPVLLSSRACMAVLT